MGRQARGTRLLSSYFMSALSATASPTFETSLARRISSRLRMTRSIVNVIHALSRLMVGYENILNASGDIDEGDLKVDKKALVAKFLTNPLDDFFELLAKSLITRSAESIELIQSKTRDESSTKMGSPKKKAKIAQSDDIEDVPSIDDLPRTPSMPYVNPNTIHPATPVNKKRDFSDGSYGSSSTETTPLKLSHPEQHTQELQNCLMRKLIKHVWLGGAEISWAQGREMYLDYISFDLVIFFGLMVDRIKPPSDVV